MNQAMNVTARLAELAADLFYDGLPEDIIQRSRMFVLDAAATMMAAVTFSRDNDDRMLRAYLDVVAAQPGPSSIVGHGMSTTPMMAAFANGVMMEVLDYSDSNLKYRTHNGTPILPAALAVAEYVEASWAQLATAIIVGYEVHTRFLAAVQPGHWHRGFQSAGTFGTCGAATAAARLLGLTTDQMRHALGISGCLMSISNSDNEFLGYSAKPIHGGQAAMNGVSSAFLSQSGYHAAPLEGQAPRHQAALHILSDGLDLKNR